VSALCCLVALVVWKGRLKCSPGMSCSRSIGRSGVKPSLTDDDRSAVATSIIQSGAWVPARLLAWAAVRERGTVALKAGVPFHSTPLQVSSGNKHHAQSSQPPSRALVVVDRYTIEPVTSSWERIAAPGESESGSMGTVDPDVTQKLQRRLLGEWLAEAAVLCDYSGLMRSNACLARWSPLTRCQLVISCVGEEPAARAGSLASVNPICCPAALAVWHGLPNAA
jgi:hypothetical protein